MQIEKRVLLGPVLEPAYKSSLVCVLLLRDPAVSLGPQVPLCLEKQGSSVLKFASSKKSWHSK